MAIIYSYPQTKPIQGNELFVVSSRTTGQPTMSIELSQIIDYIPTVLDLDTFDLFGHGFTIPPVIVNNDVITYNSTTSTWEAIPVPNPVIPTEVYTVAATYDSGGNTYNGVGTPTVTQYESSVIYNTTFDTTNTSDSPTLNIDGVGAQPLVVIDNTGVPQPIPSGTIVNNQIYYISSWAGNFQLSTTAPPPDDNPVVYWNANPVSIGSDVGGVPVSTQSNPVTWEKPDGTGYTFQECMNRIFYPYQLPAFNSFNMTQFGGGGNQSKILEVGDTLQGPNREFNWTFNSFTDNIEPGTLTIYDNNTPINTGATNPIGGPQSITSPGAGHIGNSITLQDPGSRSWYATIDTTADNPNGVQTISSNNFTVNWYYKWFWGYSSNTTLTNNQIVALQNTVGPSSSNPSAVTVGFPPASNGQYWYLAFPDSWGNITTWKTGGAGGTDVDTEPGAPYINQDGIFNYALVTNVPINGGLGNPTTYRVYRTLYAQSTSTNVYINI